jgi:DNA-binding transcriptional MerR regulator
MSMNRHLLSRGIASSRTKNFSIGEISKRSGVNIGTIRFYERIKILPAPPRTASGRRAYDGGDLRILAFIRRARELGFSLDEIRVLLRLGAPESRSCRESGKLRPVALKIFAQGSLISQQSSVCWRGQSRAVPTIQLQRAPFWKSSMGNAATATIRT